MKKRVIGFLLAIAMVVSTTACSIPYMNYINRQELEEAKEELREEQEEQGQQVHSVLDEMNASNEESLADLQPGNEQEEGGTSGSNDGAHDGAQDGAQQEVVFSIDLNTVDAYGNTVDKSIVSGAKVVMINFWEPWCGPCVGEIPDLELLYENYKDHGLVIIGAYTTSEMIGDIQDIIETNGLTYPVIEASADTYRFMSDYVPTTCFMDASGNPLPDYQYIGSRSYDDWATIIESYLVYIENNNL